jgi:hypothetical protein
MGRTGILDAAHVAAALGPRLAERFLQYAVEPADGERGELMLRIDEHLAQMRRAAERRNPAAPDHAGVDALATLGKRLLLRLGDAAASADTRAAIAGAVRYFIDTHDLERDDAPLGLEDDALVMNYVVSEVAPELARV